MYARRTVFMCLVLIAGFAGRSIAREMEQITCTGKVVDAQGQSVPGAKVGLYTLILSMDTFSFDVELSRQTTTKDDGTFSFETVAESNDSRNQTVILADKEGLALGWANWYLTEDLDVQITLGRPMVLAGQVVDESGEPVINAEVSISVMSMTGGDEPSYIAGKISEQLFSCETNAAGKFQFERIPPDAAAEFIAKKVGLATVGTLDENNAQGWKLQFNAGRKDIEIKLPVEAKIEGVVVEKDSGKPVPGVKLVVFEEQHQMFSGREPVISRDDGTFSVGALCPGKQIVRVVSKQEGPADWVAQPVEVAVEAGRTSSGVKVQLSEGGMVEVSVTELDDDKPIGGASVNIQDTVSKEQFSGGTDNDGIMRKRLAPGEYRLISVYKRDYRYEHQKETFTLEDGKTNRVVVQLRGYLKVAGTVRDENGRPVAGARIKVYPLGRGETTSDAEGRYEVRRETPDWAPEVVPYVVARHIERNLAAAVEIEEDARLVDVNMTTGVVLAGKVIDVGGKPIEKAQIYLTFWSSNSGSSMEREKSVTNAEGRYEIRAVPQHHEYSVNADADGYGQDYVRIAADDAVNNHLEVKAISLAPANLSVSGIVVDVEDKPVDNAHVSCQGRGQPYRNTQTDKDGKFIIEGVCAGSIRIYVDKSNTSSLSGNIEAVGGAANIRIVASERSSGSVPKQPPSLIGKPLPDLDGLAIELAPADTENKTMLICFWDMQQRPSRNCILQLTKQADRLKEKGVAIFAIHASKVDESTLDEWIKKNNIPFPVGMIRDDENKTCFNWGVKSLPWLILTDRSHVIRAEGFGFDNLDTMIKEMNNVAQ